MNVNIGETTTPRNVFEIFRRESLDGQRENRPLFRENGVTPRFILKSDQVRGHYWPAVSANDWNAQGKNFQPGKLYYFEYIDMTPEEIRAYYLSFLPLLRPVLDHYRDTHGGAKVIPGSSAATPEIPKNVRQQFKFDKNPKTPIILVDRDFFSPKRYEFYKYLNFNIDAELSHTLDPTGQIVKVYKKPAGRGFEINPNASDIAATAADKQAYLDEVNRQRVDAEGNEYFDEDNEIEICCVKLPIEGLDTVVRRDGSFFDLLDTYTNSTGAPIFKDYTFEE